LEHLTNIQVAKVCEGREGWDPGTGHTRVQVR
jgi:hypothetical protein